MNYKKAKCQHYNNETLMEVRDINKIEQGNPSNDDYCYDMQVVLFCPPLVIIIILLMHIGIIHMEKR